MTITEEQLERWAKAPSETEEGKCQNAVARITEAIKKEFGDNVHIFLQGSYKNRTNVRLDSDVDIVASHQGHFFPDLSGLSSADKEIYHSIYKNSDYTFSQFKNDIQIILQNEFEYGEVERKNKCIKIKGNSYRVNADVVPCFSHRRYRSVSDVEAEGLGFVSDDGLTVYSFPEQHYQNGVKKNQDTDSMYKPVVRILKNIRNELVDQKKITLNDMPSFFIECLVWNVLPHTHFKMQRYHDATKNILATIYNEMLNSEVADKYAEVSDLKWLFRGNRTYEQAKAFAQHAWDYIGYEN